MANLLEKLKEMTVVVADTGDFQSIEKFRPRDATTNPSLITAAAKMPAYASLIDDAIAYCKADGGTPEEIAKRAIDRLAVVFGLKILGVIPGRVSTEVDARLSFDTQGTVDKARAIIAQYAAQGVSKERILIKIASTWRASRPPRSSKKRGSTAT